MLKNLSYIALLGIFALSSLFNIDILNNTNPEMQLAQVSSSLSQGLVGEWAVGEGAGLIIVGNHS